jgi:hypothetical protein
MMLNKMAIGILISTSDRDTSLVSFMVGPEPFEIDGVVVRIDSP